VRHDIERSPLVKISELADSPDFGDREEQPLRKLPLGLPLPIAALPEGIGRVSREDIRPLPKRRNVTTLRREPGKSQGRIPIHRSPQRAGQNGPGALRNGLTPSSISKFYLRSHSRGRRTCQPSRNLNRTKQSGIPLRRIEDLLMRIEDLTAEARRRGYGTLAYFLDTARI
jgi:hypothetical protein